MKNILIALLLIANSIILVAQTAKPVRVIQPITLEMKMEFLALVNAERAKAGIRPYKYSFEADTLAKLRNKTVLRHLQDDSIPTNETNGILFREHAHYGFDSDFTWYNRHIVSQDTSLTWRTECAAVFDFFIPENSTSTQSIHRMVLDGWKNSEDHWNAIMDSRVSYLALSWRYENNVVVVHLVLFDKELRDPDVIMYRKGTEILR